MDDAAELPPPAPPPVVIELPAAPQDLRPSLLAPPLDAPPGPEPDGLHALDAPLPVVAPASLDTLRAEALRHLQREGSWRLALRALGVLLGVLLAFRLAFDEALPRLLLGLAGGAGALAVVVLGLHHLNESRRQSNLLAALAQVAQIARENPAQLPLLTAHLDALLAALRVHVTVWPPSPAPDPLARALHHAVADPRAGTPDPAGR